ncbi:MAG TPA: 6-phosphofructokinase, partial [Planctomycetota bacterium]|nr:6-phosphofructokinase [Planctomycetota bacterium]
RVFSIDAFVADVERVNQKLGRCLVAVSEGIHDAAGKSVVESKEVDSHGNAQLSGSGALGDFLGDAIKKRLGEKLRVRVDTFGYLQRSFAGVWSEVDATEAREVGRTAVRAATAGERTNGSVVIQREPGAGYRARYEITELKNVAKETRPMEERFLRGENDVAPAFLEYARPLVGHLPVTARLSDIAVAKKL